MDCRELTNDLLADHAGWKLAPEEQRLVSAHLEGCRPCRGRRDEVDVLASALRNTAPRPPAALLGQIDRAVLGALPRREPRRPRLWTWAAAAVLLLGTTAFVAVLFFNPRPEPRTATAPPVERPEPPKSDVPAVAQPPREEPKPEPKPDLPSEAPAPKGAKEGPRPEPPVVVPPAPQPDPKPGLPSEAPPPKGAKEGPKPDAPKPPPPSPPPPPLPAPSGPAKAAPKVIVLGDVDGDGVTDIADARRIQQALVLGLPLPPEADVNGDGVVDVADVRQITRAEVAAR